MIAIRKAEDRGGADHGWLRTKHTFSFAEYYDPDHMGFRSLRVINDDVIQPGEGFGTHGHRDMEIVTYVLEGALEHKDSMGNTSVLTAGMLQRMTAGTGVRHSEYNASDTERVHLYQIWILPERTGLSPSYEEMMLNGTQERGTWRVVASPEGKDGGLIIHQDARLQLGLPTADEDLVYSPAPGRYVWVQVMRGTITFNGQELHAGDGAAVSDERTLVLRGDGEVLLFDLA